MNAVLSAYALGAFLMAPLPAADTALIGTVRVTGPAQERAVVLTLDPNAAAQAGKAPTEARDVPLVGDLVAELGHLSASKVEVLGSLDGNRLRVQGYRILDVGAGAKPLVGTLQMLAGTVLALSDGEGDPVPLSLDPSSKQRLTPQVGAKIWVFGKKLLSGELRVARYGILREAAHVVP